MPYFVVEGQDATGKTTQVELLEGYLLEQGKEVLVVGEPEGKIGGGYAGELEQNLSQLAILRDLVKNRRYALEPETYVLLFTAARKEIAEKLIGPALDRDVYVLASRNWYSTLAYQGRGQGMDPRFIKTLTRKYMPLWYYRPQHAVILTVPEEIRQARQAAREYASERDTFESQGEEFQWQVDRAYLEVASEFDVKTVEAINLLETQERIRKIFGVA